MTQRKKLLTKTYKRPGWWKRNRVEIWTVILGLVAINLIFFANAYRKSCTVNPEIAGQLGDFVGGYIGTIFALVSVVLLYSTFKNQRESAQVEKFENKYFELIKMHRDNVSQIGIGNDFGTKIFVILIREFRLIHVIAKEIAKKTEQNFSQEEIFIISYYALFFGVGFNSSRMLKEALRDFDKNFVDEFESTLNTKETKEKAKKERNLKFTPFEGHQSRLGHYFRHMYQTVCYVDNQTINIDKYEYVKTIRAQLTTHEQALLFITCLTPIGKVWWTKELLIKYRFVQNIPHGFFDKQTEIDLNSYFPYDNYFEWQERADSKTQPS